MKEVDGRLRSPFGVYTAEDADLALGRVFGAGVRPLHLEEAVWEAMLEGWRAQQVARYFKPKTIKANLQAARSFRAFGAVAVAVACRGRRRVLHRAVGPGARPAAAD